MSIHHPALPFILYLHLLGASIHVIFLTIRTHIPRARACCPSACGLRSEILKPPPPPAWRINRTRCRNAVKVRSLDANDCSIAELGVKSSCWDTQATHPVSATLFALHTLPYRVTLLTFARVASIAPRPFNLSSSKPRFCRRQKSSCATGIPGSGARPTTLVPHLQYSCLQFDQTNVTSIRHI